MRLTQEADDPDGEPRLGKRPVPQQAATNEPMRPECDRDRAGADAFIVRDGQKTVTKWAAKPALQGPTSRRRVDPAARIAGSSSVLRSIQSVSRISKHTIHRYHRSRGSKDAMGGEESDNPSYRPVDSATRCDAARLTRFVLFSCGCSMFRASLSIEGDRQAVRNRAVPAGRTKRGPGTVARAFKCPAVCTRSVRSCGASKVACGGSLLLRPRPFRAASIRGAPCAYPAV